MLPSATHLIRITSPGLSKPIPSCVLSKESVLDLEFFDYDQRYADTYDLTKIVPPTLEQVSLLIEFGCKLPPTARLLVQCQLGISRSPACLFSILCARQPAIAPEKHLQHVVEIRPMSWPNDIVVQLADDLLGRGGDMMEALRQLKSLGTLTAKPI